MQPSKIIFCYTYDQFVTLRREEMPTNSEKLNSSAEKKETEPEIKQTFTIASQLRLVVEAGGGALGFGGVVVYQEKPNNRKLDDPVEGIRFVYEEVARIKVHGRTVWINKELPDAPKGRQDVLERGLIELELFEGTARKTLENNEKQAKKLGFI